MIFKNYLKKSGTKTVTKIPKNQNNNYLWGLMKSLLLQLFKFYSLLDIKKEGNTPRKSQKKLKVNIVPNNKEDPMHDFQWCSEH